METPQSSTQRLDHLGIVAGICHEIELAEQIDQRVSKTKGKVSVVQAVQAMVLNTLGFVGRPLYLTPAFFANKPVDGLIGIPTTPTPSAMLELRRRGCILTRFRSL